MFVLFIVSYAPSTLTVAVTAVCHCSRLAFTLFCAAAVVQGEVVVAIWAAILVNTASLIMLIVIRAVTALAFHTYRYRFMPDAVDSIRCILCRCCLVTPTSRRRRRRPDGSGPKPGGEADTVARDALVGGSAFRGYVCGCRCMALTCCERVDAFE